MKRAILADLAAWQVSTRRKPLLLYGARQVGKTHALKAFGASSFRAVHYVNFEEQPDYASIFNEGLSPQRVVKNLQTKTGVSIDIEHDLLVFDEIQDSAAALTSLKYFAEDLPELALCGAGSRLGLALKDGSFPVGKVDTLHLYPLSFPEFIEASQPHLTPILTQEITARDIPAQDIAAQDSAAKARGSGMLPQISETEHQVLWRALKDYYIVGGLPEVVACYVDHQSDLFNAYVQARRVQRTLLQGYMSDFAKHAGKENAAHIHRVFSQVPVQIQSVYDDSVKRFRFKGLIPNRSRYADLAGPIDWLVKSGLVYKCHLTETPEIPLKAYIKENLFKLYLFDIGLLGAMLDLPIDAILEQDYGSYKGWAAENYVAQALIPPLVTSGRLLHSEGVSLVSWRRNQAEIEFIVQRKNGVMPIEVKSGSRTRSKSLSAYRQRYSPPCAVRLSAKRPAIHGGASHGSTRHSEITPDEPALIDYPLYLASNVLAL